ncbi:hypothetical protein IWW57_002704 [Coemansia sp. S610]|nr:hypothetical protein IWW57_002704 [Coemansia sp. S610]KAJ2414087.1 hypothetical protein GGI10_002617 [Coemansia sp. RSA 2530]KAJ2697230.1 hypothetical protein H4218_004088 [Coemansia sp. IMI 209128]
MEASKTASASHVLFLQRPACSRVPPEILLEIFALVAPSQASLRACILTCRQWNLVGTPVLWRRPQFHRLSSVEHFASTLVSFTSGAGVSHYAKLVETVSFSTLPEVDRNNPQLATLLDTIVNCMVVPTKPTLGLPAKPSGRNLLLPPVIKRSRSLSRNNASCSGGVTSCDVDDPLAARPLSATDLQLADGDAATIAAAVATGVGPAAEQDGEAASERQALATAVYTSSLRQLDLRFCKGVRNYSLQRLAPRLASINVLNLAGGLRTDITIAKLSQHMTDLRRVSLAWTSNLTDFGVSELVQRCKGIEALDLTYCMQIEDTSMLAIAHNLHSLAALSVAYCAGVTDIGVREVATRFPGIQIINVAKCLRVTDRMRKHLAQGNVVYACDSFDPFSIYRNRLQPRAKKAMY